MPHCVVALNDTGETLGQVLIHTRHGRKVWETEDLDEALNESGRRNSAPKDTHDLTLYGEHLVRLPHGVTAPVRVTGGFEVVSE